MNKIQLILAFSAILLCSQVLCQTNSKKQKIVYRLHLNWPVLESYSGGNVTRKDLPLFNGDNFALQAFQPSMRDIEYIKSPFCSTNYCPHQPLNVGKIQESDYKYLQKYFSRFGQASHNTTKELWNEYGPCTNSDQTKYFSDMVKAHKKFNIVKALKAKNIVPDNNKFYSSEEFADALKDMLGTQTPTFWCGHDETRGDIFIQYLTGFDIFLDEHLNPIQDMPTLCNYQYCVGDFIYPKLNF